jgi:hypothetical protein
VTEELSDDVRQDALAGYMLYDAMIERLALRYPGVPLSRIEAIAHHEYEAMTGGALHVVPRELEEGVAERLSMPRD